MTNKRIGGSRSTSKPSYRKMVLVDQAELSRLRQKQIKDYNPQLRVMEELRAEMERALFDKNLSVEERVALYQNARNRYENIKQEAPRKAVDQATAFVNQNQTQQQLQQDGPSILAPHPSAIAATSTPLAARESTGARVSFSSATPQKLFGTQSYSGEYDIDYPSDASDAEIPPQEEETAAFYSFKQPKKSVSPKPLTAKKEEKEVVEASVEALDVQLPQQYHKKFKDLTNQLVHNYPGAIDVNPEGEIVLFGKRIPNTNAKDLFRSLYMHSKNKDIPGRKRFIEALRTLPIKPNLVSVKNVQNKLAASKSLSLSTSARKTPKQSGKGVLGRNHIISASHPASTPPGRRIKILRVYPR